eukprot:CAMPEP_0168353144 /NCGR_PEP_ID=MMETSP0213-20121227/23057_1 /TAXON_ID=151035 /ORGANISM="Euplotes harpa, Strain FSP1.4" /LENGTH=134 /DNA_ID=CAMNT_0008364661 /DNA_START=104 /DNA_END=509 /DNA_ORIENTATION=+
MFFGDDLFNQGDIPDKPSAVKDDIDKKMKLCLKFKEILTKIKYGFESTENLEESRKKVGLEVFEKIFRKADNFIKLVQLQSEKIEQFGGLQNLEQGDCFSYNSWLEIEYQCSQELSRINVEMSDRLKQHNLDSL